MGKRKTWHEKLHDNKDFPRIEVISDKLSKRWGSGTVVIPRPIEVDELMRSVPTGRLVTINRIRQKIALNHGATIGCPLTIGIFARIAAEAASEDAAQGATEITPYWRTLRAEGEINPKFPGGISEQSKRLGMEGHLILKRGKRFFVDPYEHALFTL